MTLLPALANRIAVALPIPAEAPVMRTTLSCRREVEKTEVILADVEEKLRIDGSVEVKLKDLVD